MPTYEYACESCGRRYEKREGFDALARQKCQFCGKTANRVLFAPPVVFKGSGFYKTDSRGTTTAPAEAASTPSADGGDSKGAGSKTKSADSSSDSNSSDGTASEAPAAG